MRFYNQAHAFYCGVDLHARTMYLCVFNHAGQKMLHKGAPSDPAALLEDRTCKDVWRSLWVAAGTLKSCMPPLGPSSFQRVSFFGGEFCPRPRCALLTGEAIKRFGPS